MKILFISLIVFLSLNIIFYIVVIYMQLYYNLFEKKNKRLLDYYKDILIEYGFSDSIELKSFKRIFIKKYFLKMKNGQLLYLKKSKTDKVHEELIDAVIECINVLDGKFRKKIIEISEKIGLVEYLLNELKKNDININLEYNLYRLGELRSLNAYTELLDMDIEYIFHKRFEISYYFGILTIIDEWFDEIDNKLIKRYIDKIIEIFLKIDSQNLWELKRILEYFLNSTNKFFNYILRDDEIKKYFLDHIYEITDTSKKYGLKLITKGEILYIIAINKEYSIIDKLMKEFDFYLYKDNKTNEEIEFLIKIIKAIGELNIEKGRDIFLDASKTDNWIIKSIAAKYLANYGDVTDVLYENLFHNNWWVRYNSAISLSKQADEGISYLLKALTTDDKYAKEVAAFSLSVSKYSDNIIRILRDNELDMVYDEVCRVMNEGNDVRLFSKIIFDEKINDDHKAKVINSINNNKFLNYYNNFLKDRDLGERINRTLKNRVKHYFL